MKKDLLKPQLKIIYSDGIKDAILMVIVCVSRIYLRDITL